MARNGNGSPPNLIWLGEHDVDRAIAGGKGASLARLLSLDAPVPEACVLTTAAWEAFSTSTGLQSPSAKDDPARIRALVANAPMPPPLVDAISHIYQRFEMLPGAHVSLAVRSSGTMEDSGSLSFAGLHDTILGVRSHAGLEIAIRQCWASLWSDRAVDYRRAARLVDEEPSIAVVIQQVVRPDVSFVLFTVDPVTGNPDHTVITATWGLGESVVSGRVTPDHIVVDRDGRIVRYVVGAKEFMTLEDPPPEEGTRQVPVPRVMQGLRALTDDQAARIASIGQSLAEKLGFPADIEGGIADGQVWLFQARPITTLQDDNEVARSRLVVSSIPSIRHEDHSQRKQERTAP